MEQARKLLEGVELVDSPWDAITGAAAAVIVTEWDAYRALDLVRMKSLLVEPVLVDLRNIYERETVEEASLRYYAVGR
jgi:UDPglucose 6-dehydrogenase